MVRFRLLGSIDLLDENDNERRAVLAQPKRLALLAYLCITSRLGPSRRDTVLGVFWPELDQDRARKALNKAVHFLRQELGEEVLVSRSAEELAVDAERLWCDVSAFDAAVSVNDHAKATDLYRGDLLKGVFLEESHEFGEWLERERTRLRVAASRAAHLLARQLEQQANLTSAVQMARRAVELSDSDEPVFRELLELLDRLGDRAGAVHAYETFADRLAREYETEPAAETKALIAQIRGREEARGISLRPAQRDPVRHSGLAASPVQTLLQQPRRYRSRKLIPAMVGILVVVALSAWLVRRQLVAPAPALSSLRVAVFPFDVRGGPELQYLGEAVMDLLSQAVDGAGDLRRVYPSSITRRLRGNDSGPVDPALGRALAVQLGAGRFLLGTASVVDERLRISASLYDAAGANPIATSTQEGKPEALTHLVETVARELLAGQTLGTGARLRDIRSVHAANFPALRDYLQGEALLRRGWFDSAGAKLASAVRGDSTFGLAWYRLAYAQGWGAAGSAGQSFAQAMRYRGSLSARDRLLVEGRTAFSGGDAAKAESVATTLTGRYPDDVEAWHLLGLTRGFYRWQRGVPHWVSRAPMLRALALDPEYPEAVAHATMSAVHAGLYAQAESLLPRYPRGGGAGPVRKGLRAALAYATGSVALRDSIVRDVTRESDWVVFNIAFQLSQGDSLRAAVWVWNYLADDADRGPVPRASAQLHLGYIEMARGRRQAALAELAQAARVRPSLAFATLVWLSVIPFFQVPDSEVAALRDSVQHWHLLTAAPSSDTALVRVWIPHELGPWARDYFLGLVTARVGDSVSAVRHAAALERATDPADAIGLRRDLALEIRAMFASRAGRPSEALALLERTRLAVSSELVALNPVYRRPIGRFLRAEALLALGRIDEALGWYDSFGTGAWGTEYVYGAPVRLRMGEIYERKAELELAIAHYSRFVAKWRDADAQYQPLVRDVEARLARLKRQRG